MYILGVNAISGCHDSSACLIKDGMIRHFVEEERFLNFRHAFNTWPHRAIQYCLDAEGISIDDINYIANGWDINNYRGGNDIQITRELFIEKLIPKYLFSYKKAPQVFMIPHHLAHAASSFRTSGWRNAGILVIDGEGENESISLFISKEGNVELLETYPIKCSLGFFYESVAKYVGLKTTDAGKLMGLASYGSANLVFNDFILEDDNFNVLLNNVDLKSNITNYNQVKSMWSKVLIDEFGPPNQSKSDFIKEMNIYVNSTEFNDKYKNIAASAQAFIEEIIMILVKRLVKSTNIRRLAYAGGVALNCVANGKILKNNLVDDLYIFPAANDAGTSVGAALELSHRLMGESVYHHYNHSYFGPEYKNEDIEKLFNFLKIKYRKVENAARVAAELLDQNKIIGWFQGRMEAGPRALGNRSILANPRYYDNLTKVNKEIKFREEWRPFAPSIMYEKYKYILDEKWESPFMILSANVKQEWCKKVPAVVHVDGSTRPQTVRREDNPLYWELINAFYEKTGIPLVLNTSFNIKGRPIVCSPLDAIKAFFTSALDALVIGNFLLLKE